MRSIVNYPALLRSLTLATWKAGLPVSPTGRAGTADCIRRLPQRSQSPQALDSARPVPIGSTGQLRRDGDCTRLFSRLNAGRGVAPAICSDMSDCGIKLTARIPSLLARFARSLREGPYACSKVNEDGVGERVTFSGAPRKLSMMGEYKWASDYRVTNDRLQPIPSKYFS